MKNLIFTLILLVSTLVSIAQNNTIRGTVYDKNTAETMPFVNVFIEGTTIGTTTDLDGNFAITNLASGVYNLSFSFVSYQTKTVENIEAGTENSQNISIQLSDKELEIEEVVVKAERVTNSDIAVLNLKKKSVNVLDGISSETFKKTGDGNAAAAIKRVTGVSVEGGKYVYVRGLGDRYTKTTLNGVDIPGLDPDRNTVQMDIFPANLLDNLVVFKTFSPNLPGDFTGGMIDIQTKNFPSSKTINISGNLSFNTISSFNKEFYTYKSGTLDKLALGNKYRKLHFDGKQEIPQYFEYNEELTNITKGFNTQLAPTTKNSLVNGGLSFSAGNQINKEKVTLGYNAALNYSRNTTHFDNYEVGEYAKDVDATINELNVRRNQKGVRSSEEYAWSGLLAGAMKTKNSKYRLNLLHSQNATSTAGKFTAEDEINSTTKLNYNLEYSQRMMTNILLAGDHNLKSNKWQLEWKLSPTISKIVEPDIRQTSYLIEEGEFLLQSASNAIPTRSYRSLNEINISSKIDATYNFEAWSGSSKLKFGVLETFKMRDYEILRYDFNSGIDNLTGNGDEFFNPENIWTLENTEGTYVKETQSSNRNSNIYQASQNIFAAYVMNELPLTNKLKAVYGLRIEKADNLISGYGKLNDETPWKVIEDEKVLNEIDFLPAFNLIYTINEKMNFRTSYSRTLARPSFKEKSFVEIDDNISGRRFLGNIALQQTNIDNFDLRWEWFFGRGEIFSTSVFYKHFKNPIEISSFQNAPNQITPRNVGNAQVMGLEIEARKNFAFISEKMKDLSTGTNLTYVHSRVNTEDIQTGNTDGQTEYQSRLDNAREGEDINKIRPMYGQSPYIINVYVNYSNKTSGTEANLSYNVQGKRLSVVGIGRVPNVYEQAFHSLNLKISQAFGKEKRWKTSFLIDNLIGDNKEFLYESYEAKDQVYERYDIGRTFQLGVSYTIK